MKNAETAVAEDVQTELVAKEEPTEPEIPRPSDEELPAVIEALLFAATSPLSIKRLVMLTGETPAELVQAAIGDLRARYENSTNCGLMVMEVAGGYQLATRPSVADWVLALHKHRRKNPISSAMLETLAIVAYKQPIVRAEVESIRGVDCGAVMRALLDSGLVEVIGQRETPGRPSLYGTTDVFLKTFGLKDLKELPSLSDLHKILHAKMRRPEDEEAPAAEETTQAPEASPSPEASQPNEQPEETTAPQAEADETGDVEPKPEQ